MEHAAEPKVGSVLKDSFISLLLGYGTAALSAALFIANIIVYTATDSVTKGRQDCTTLSSYVAFVIGITAVLVLCSLILIVSKLMSSEPSTVAVGASFINWMSHLVLLIFSIVVAVELGFNQSGCRELSRGLYDVVIGDVILASAFCSPVVASCGWALIDFYCGNKVYYANV
eukprot:TRINITY_DN9067_c0_g1_i3.p2 TRINITY_DN9067_c0_g1~~TRINITY_DN9067_c0_g1_i3.p2  ORF type:complete len:172 (-),score=40.88 TRINITY_DN9067_c0_g1_i3:89-604(-)